MTVPGSDTPQKSERDTSLDVTTGKPPAAVNGSPKAPATKLQSRTSSNEDNSDCSTPDNQRNGHPSDIDNHVQKLWNGRERDAGPISVKHQIKVEDSVDGIQDVAIQPMNGCTKGDAKDKLDHQTQDQSVMRQPRLAFSKRFTNDGGILQDPRSDVVLTVPPGAVPPGESAHVCVKIHTDLMNYTKWVPNETASILGPVVECEVDRKMTFLKPVTLSIPLCGTPQRSLDVLCSDGNRFKTIALDKEMSYRIEGRMLHIETTHFTKFLVNGEVIDIKDVLLTLAARFRTGSCSTLELRPMAHVNCLSMKEFTRDRELNYHKDMEIIDSQPVSLPERGTTPLQFPEILLEVWVKEDSLWRIVDGENKDATSCSLVKKKHGMDVLNTVNSESRPLKNFILESEGIVNQAECKMNITFKYAEDDVEPAVHTFTIVYPRNETAESIASGDARPRRLSVLSSARPRLSSGSEYKVSAEDHASVEALAKSIINELRDRKDRLVGSEGLGVHARKIHFRTRVETLKILDHESLENIQTLKTKSEAAAMLIEQLLPCGPTKLVLFAWLLVDVEQDHQLPDSITPDVKSWLQTFHEDGIVHLVQSI